MENTTGGNYHCPSCNFAVNDLMYRPSNCDMPFPQGFGKQEGWICPVCGRGLAPWVDYCPCQGSELKITYGTSTGVEQPDDWKEYFDLFRQKNNI
jgi:predicted amidophosphoribosyltransferase